MRPGLPWTWITATGLVGAAIGWAVGTVARTVIARDDDRASTTDRSEFGDIDRPNTPVSLDN